MSTPITAALHNWVNPVPGQNGAADTPGHFNNTPSAEIRFPADHFNPVTSAMANLLKTDHFDTKIGTLAKQDDVKDLLQKTHFDTAIAEVKTLIDPNAATAFNKTAFFKQAGAAALGSSPAWVGSGVAAWKAWTADAKLNHNGVQLRQTAAKLAEGVKIPAWLKGTAIATLLVAGAGFVNGMGQRAAKRVV